MAISDGNSNEESRTPSVRRIASVVSIFVILFFVFCSSGQFAAKYHFLKDDSTMYAASAL